VSRVSASTSSVTRSRRVLAAIAAPPTTKIDAATPAAGAGRRARRAGRRSPRR
jgi:hypothetical protein